MRQKHKKDTTFVLLIFFYSFFLLRFKTKLQTISLNKVGHYKIGLIYIFRIVYAVNAYRSLAFHQFVYCNIVQYHVKSSNRHSLQS